jgi:hypothetical protein
MGRVKPGPARANRAVGSAAAPVGGPAGSSKPAGAGRPGGAAAEPAKSEGAAAPGVRATLAAFAAAPRALAGAAVLVTAEGLLLVGLGLLQVVRGFGPDIDNLARAEFGGVISLLGGLVVLALARRLVADLEASRTPVVVIELLCLPVGWAMADNGLYGYGIPLLVVAVAILVLLATAALRARHSTSEQG